MYMVTLDDCLANGFPVKEALPIIVKHMPGLVESADKNPQDGYVQGMYCKLCNWCEANIVPLDKNDPIRKSKDAALLGKYLNQYYEILAKAEPVIWLMTPEEKERILEERRNHKPSPEEKNFSYEKIIHLLNQDYPQ